MIFVTARMRACRGHIGDLEQAARGLIAPTLSEAGCIFYELYRSVDNDSDLLFFECWKDRNALEQHLRQPHVKKFMKAIAQLLDGQVEVHRWEKVEGASNDLEEPCP